jgi:lysophospholipase L1-like esterase
LPTVTIAAGGSQTLDPGTAFSVTVVNTGAENAVVNSKRLRPGQNETFYLQGTALIAASRYGTTVSYTATQKPVSTFAPSIAAGYARRTRTLPNGKILVSDRNLSLRSNAVAAGNHTHHHTKTVRVACTDVQFRFPHYNASANTEAVAVAALTFRASARINGQNHELTVNGSRDITIATSGGYVDTDPLAVEIPAGTAVVISTYVISGTPYSISWAANTNTYGDSYTLSADATGPSAAVGTGTAAHLYGPSLMFGTPQAGVTVKPVVGIFGDSVARGWSDDSLYGGDGGGYLVRALNTAGLPWLNIARPTATSINWADYYGRKIRVASIADVDYGIMLLGGNDIYSASQTATQVRTNLIARAREVFASRGIPLYLCTITPSSASSDSWATTGNQTASAFNPIRNAVNDWMRLGCPLDAGTFAPLDTVSGALLAGQSGHPFAGVIDAVSAIETSTGSSLWKAPGYTADGLHPTTVGHTAMAPLVDTSVFVAR